MTTFNPPSGTCILCQYPIPLTVDEVKLLLVRLQQNDEVAKKLITFFIKHRLNDRYIRPLLNVPSEYKSGFLMMAAACLLIEALQSFYDGKNESSDDNEDLNDKRRGCETAFRKFFERNAADFSGFRDCFPIGPVIKGKTRDICYFYKHIRCGILHQAETTGGYRILRKGPLFDKEDKAGPAINADAFLEAMQRCLDKYISALQSSAIDTRLWKMAVKKLGHICKNCQRSAIMCSPPCVI